jgi:riboflavin synthase
MFTGIIESMGELINRSVSGTNVDLYIRSSLSHELKIDQSVSHNGVCLTVVEIGADWHRVTAVEETMQRSNLGRLGIGDHVNLERAMLSGSRLDGHIVQGHVDQTARCTGVEENDGSWTYHFSLPKERAHLMVDKGSICINGVSLTVVNPTLHGFSVAIIPYTWEHTTFKTLREGDLVNLEYDILGKYIARYMELYREAGSNPVL